MGLRTFAVSLGMAQASVAEGGSILACTPHILPGLYPNAGPQIALAVQHWRILSGSKGFRFAWSPACIWCLFRPSSLIRNDSTGFSNVMSRFGNSSVPGCGCKITSGSLRETFGRNGQRWAYRMLEEGWVYIPAMDAHDTRQRRPDSSRGQDAAAARIGIEEAETLGVHTTFRSH
jgi:protein-tyrosine phosphatase